VSHAWTGSQNTKFEVTWSNRLCRKRSKLRSWLGNEAKYSLIAFCCRFAYGANQQHCCFAWSAEKSRRWDMLRAKWL